VTVGYNAWSGAPFRLSILEPVLNRTGIASTVEDTKDDHISVVCCEVDCVRKPAEKAAAEYIMN
jgi:hypothetical protein